MAELRAYATQTDVYVPLIQAGGDAFTETATFVAGDVQIIKDGGAAANTTNLPTHVANGIYKLTLTAAEMTAKKIVVTIRDQDATPVWKDQAVYLETYGDANAEHPFDLGAAEVTVGSLSATAKSEVNAEVADVLKVDTVSQPAQGAPPATPTMEDILRWLYTYFRNKRTQTSSLISLYDDAGTTVIAKATISDDGTIATKEEFVSGP